jgi:hypothetical protein
VIAEIIATLALIYDFADDHPDIVKLLADEAKKLLGGHKLDETTPGREAMRGLAAGMAASRAKCGPRVRPPAEGGEEVTPFLQARHYRPSGRLTVKWVVLHSAEIGESLDGAEILMRRCAEKRVDANGKEIVSSWHYAVDADSATQSVREEDIAFHAPGANAAGIGIELCGRARQSLLEWDDEYSRSMIIRAAALTAEVCQRWGIPVGFVTADGLLRGVSGITTHAEVSKAWKKSTHTDPGMFFPTQKFLDLTAHYKRGLA